MPRILAHRGNLNGPSGSDENQLAGISRALDAGWGVEIDIRRTDDGRFYISHDPIATPEGRAAEPILAEISQHPDAIVALNIKEEGHEAELLELLARTGVRQQVFLFDMELIETQPGAMAQRFRALDPEIRIAARVSDRGEPVDRALANSAASVIWLDEFDRLWLTESIVRELKASGRSLYAVSPDLHQFSRRQTRARWLAFARWGVDGICTDYPAALDRVFDLVRTPRKQVA